MWIKVDLKIENPLFDLNIWYELPEWIWFEIYEDFMYKHWYAIIINACNWGDNDIKIRLSIISWILSWKSSLKKLPKKEMQIKLIK